MSGKIYQITGAGIAGQVLAKELMIQHRTVSLRDTQAFPRRKVCGGVLQQDTWKYLKQTFDLQENAPLIHHAEHFVGKKRIATQKMTEPMIYIRRFEMDDIMMQSFREDEIQGEGNAIEVIPIDAAGIQCDSESEWLGFESVSDPVDCLEMRYGKKIYAGRCPDGDKQSHLAFVLHRDLLRSKMIADVLHDELGIRCEMRPKGTRAISYQHYTDRLAVGDAKMTSHPLFGFGMKHAVLSARLLAKCIQQNRIEHYHQLHRKLFSKLYRLNQVVDKTYQKWGGKWLTASLALPGVLSLLYQQVHSKKEERFIEAL